MRRLQAGNVKMHTVQGYIAAAALARYWFSRAAAQGDSKAADALKDIR